MEEKYHPTLQIHEQEFFNGLSHKWLNKSPAHTNYKNNQHIKIK